MRRYELAAVLVSAVALRLLFLIAWPPGLIADAWDYDRLARSLVEGRGYTNTRGELTSWRPPLYPAFVAGVYLFTEGSAQAVRVLQIALDMGTVALTCQVAAWLFGRAAGLIAGLLIAVNLGTIAATGWLASETLFTFLLVAGVAASVAWLGALRQGRAAAALVYGMGAGALLAAGALTRGVLLLYPLLLVVCGALSLRALVSASGWAPTLSQRRWAALSGCLALALTFALFLTPWSVRNYRVHGAFIPVATQVGLALYGSYNPLDGWIFGNHPQDEITTAAKRLPEQEANAFLTRAAVESVLASPARTLRLEALKTLYFWVPLDWEVLPFYGVFNPTYSFIALWALLYLASGSWRGNALATGVVWLPVLYLFLMALVFYGSPRFRLPAEPLLAVFGAAQLVALRRRVGPQRSATIVGGTVAALLLVGAFAGPLKLIAKGWITGAG